MLERLARFVLRHARLVVAAWLLLLAFGVFSVTRVSDRWYEELSAPGYSAYEANKRTLRIFGTGAQPPFVAVFRANRDVTQIAGLDAAIERAAAENPGARVGSFFTAGSGAYLSGDRRAMFATIYPAGQPRFEGSPTVADTRRALREAAPPGVEVNLTGMDPLALDEGEAGGPGVFAEVLLGAAGALVVLLFVFGTLPAVALPLATAAVSILSTFSLVWALTYVTNVSIIVQFLIALIGLAVAIDYALLMISRFREELEGQPGVEDALVETMKHAGHSVIVSGSTVAVGLLSLTVVPVPFVRSVGLAGMLIPLVSVCAAITLVPAVLALLGRRINALRVPVPRFWRGSAAGFWERWGKVVMRRPLAVALLGLAAVALLLWPASALNPSDPEAAKIPGAGDAVEGRKALAAAGFPAGVLKPLVVLVEGRASPQYLDAVAAGLGETPGIAGAAAPPGWRRGGNSLVEAFLEVDASSKPARATIDELQERVLPAIEAAAGGRVRMTLGGIAPEERDFVDAIYSNFPYILGFVVLLTYLLLVRAFRSLVLPLKAVFLNLLSLGAALGILVFVFQQGHGSEAIWGVEATGSVVPWVPLMGFAFLYGLSMDYEVFLLTRMRESYDELGATGQAVTAGLARTGKLVTSAALILMFAFFALSAGPGLELKQFAVAVAAGIIFDATVIRVVLAPALMNLMGSANWWLPGWAARLLLVER